MSRQERVAMLIQQEVADILRRKINDTRIGFITITQVKVSKDLAHAWIHFSQIGSETDRLNTRKGLRAATGFIKGEVGRAIRMQIVPQIHFKYDDNVEKTSQLMEKINALSDQ